ncbi:S8 family serine peptidase [Oceanobacillus caeni]|uniref:S8 family serine peptidase n=1 Tax=Oceanobacillus caeni TaxID=405946 RepID=UPI000B2AC298|nr:S8 family serine peptidase [Oceanobacillus caeni]
MYRLIFLLLLISLLNIFQPQVSLAEEEKKVDSIIIEVEGDPEERKEYIEKNYPFIDVVATYELLFNGVALQGKPRNLEKLESLEFIRAIHTVQTYEALPYFKANQTLRQSYEGLKEKKSDVIPSDLNDTEYTGKGIKVGVVDTGIDYNHPDLSNNYKAGYDLVDLDDDPMETLKEEGIPTIHGSHVAGIIAADGDLKGVAPDAEIYSYRALGPGGLEHPYKYWLQWSRL